MFPWSATFVSRAQIGILLVPSSLCGIVIVPCPKATQSRFLKSKLTYLLNTLSPFISTSARDSLFKSNAHALALSSHNCHEMVEVLVVISVPVSLTSRTRRTYPLDVVFDILTIYCTSYIRNYCKFIVVSLEDVISNSNGIPECCTYNI